MDDTTLQEQAKALGDPTRHAIFRRIARSGHSVGIAELNDEFPFTHNAIRQHLAKLVSAGLVVETKAPPAGRGRPRLVYEIDPAVEGQWGTTGPYERLSQLLAEVIHTGLGPEEVGRRAADLFRVPSPSGDIVADVTAAMARHGFDPVVRPRARRRRDRSAQLPVRRHRPPPPRNGLCPSPRHRRRADRSRALRRQRARRLRPPQGRLQAPHPAHHR
jgi:DNA-binding transcriptional ArsR family regulator